VIEVSLSQNKQLPLQGQGFLYELSPGDRLRTSSTVPQISTELTPQSEEPRHDGQYVSAATGRGTASGIRVPQGSLKLRLSRLHGKRLILQISFRTVTPKDPAENDPAQCHNYFTTSAGRLRLEGNLPRHQRPDVAFLAAVSPGGLPYTQPWLLDQLFVQLLIPFLHRMPNLSPCFFHAAQANAGARQFGPQPFDQTPRQQPDRCQVRHQRRQPTSKLPRYLGGPERDFRGFPTSLANHVSTLILRGAGQYLRHFRHLTSFALPPHSRPSDRDVAPRPRVAPPPAFHLPARPAPPFHSPLADPADLLASARPYVFHPVLPAQRPSPPTPPALTNSYTSIP